MCTGEEPQGVWIPGARQFGRGGVADTTPSTRTERIVSRPEQDGPRDGYPKGECQRWCEWAP